MNFPRELEEFVAQNSRTAAIRPKLCTNSTEVLRESLLPYLRLVGIEMPLAEMYDEGKKLIPAMVPHRADYEGHRGWKSLTLHGISSAHTQGAERYGFDPEDRSVYRWTDIARLAPVTTEFFRETFRYEYYHRIRFMLLEPGGYVMPHTDFDYYTLGPVNIALNNPEGCTFHMDNCGVVPFAPGVMNKLALINRHAVINRSHEPRLHIIVHGAPDWKFWKNVIWESYCSLSID